jgi:tetratricopeptide (TPR) repeat protein
MLNTGTSNRAAFELLTQALEDIDSYQKYRRLSALQSAEHSLTAALDKDPDYLGALFYRGIVCDLAGRPADAPPYFERVIQGAPSKEIHDEARYNWGVAKYHQYSQVFLVEAKKAFQDVIGATSDPVLRELARANLGQAHAMMMHPSSKQRAAHQAGQPFTSVHPTLAQEYKAAVKTAETCLANLQKSDLSGSERTVAIRAAAENALGMAEMYYADYVLSDTPERLMRATKARDQFLKAQQIAKDDWANTCDLASAHFRRFLWCKDVTERDIAFTEAKRLLGRVLTDLRPNYGFAYYELGRMLRCHGDFHDSVEALEKALAVDERYRDVSEAKVKSEIDRANARDTQFP